VKFTEIMMYSSSFPPPPPLQSMKSSPPPLAHHFQNKNGAFEGKFVVAIDSSLINP
jgi:hypothetical protein